MTRNSYEDDEEEESDDPEDPDESDMDDDDGEDGPSLVPCPYCGREISEDAEQCPRCGRYLSEEDSARSKPPWVVITAVALLVAILLTWVAWG